MVSVADALRHDNFDRVKELSPAERVNLALELGDFDLGVFCTHQGLDPIEARRALAES